MPTSWLAADGLRARLDSNTDVEQVPDDCLAAVIEALLADRAVVFLGHTSGAASPWRGRDTKRALDPESLEEVSRSLVERCLASSRPVTWTPTFTEGDAQSATELKLLAAVAVPIDAPARGALYVDFRRPQHVRNIANTELLEEAAEIFARTLPRHDFTPSSRPSAATRPPPPDLDTLLTLPGLFAMAAEIAMAIKTHGPVLVLGETGSGKTLLADALAARMGRKPVVRAMLGTADDLNTVVSELFGHLPGSFTGASGKRIGLVEHAHHGVLVFDEVLNLSLTAQQLLLDFVQFGEYRPLGSSDAKPRHADVRILAVTNGDLEGAVRDGRFREDLYHRLAGTVLRVPSLRERRGDIPGLAAILLPRVASEGGWRLSLSARRALISERLLWPGNVRQFEGVLRRAVERARQGADKDSRVITEHHLDCVRPPIDGGKTPKLDVEPLSDADFKARWETLKMRRESLGREEDDLILEALDARGDSKKLVADMLGFESYTTLTSRVQRIKRDRAKPTT